MTPMAEDHQRPEEGTGAGQEWGMQRGRGVQHGTGYAACCLQRGGGLCGGGGACSLLQSQEETDAFF